ncbi:MAG: NYN domain-containing protein [Nitrospiraceae bacterium]|nr:NYN domain-containing protein [Nitrospiraceae bacterium]
MARILILDGYNIIGARGAMRRDRELLARERASLVREISVWGAGRDFSEIHLVFDGYPTDRDLLLVGSGGVRVVFSEGAGTADTVIVALAGRFRERAAVVSSDREVIREISRLGAEPVSSRDFLVRLGRPAAPGRSSPPEDPYGKDPEEPPAPTFGKKKGNPRRPSKKERAQRRLLDKF